jgi:hypothetical protein
MNAYNENEKRKQGNSFYLEKGADILSTGRRSHTSVFGQAPDDIFF